MTPFKKKSGKHSNSCKWLGNVAAIVGLVIFFGRI
jgi:hypothetical protein